jgi:predicted aspartyl protease
MKNFPLSSDPKVVVIPIRIAGPKSERYVRVILDTGATYTMICPEVLDETGYDLSQPIGEIDITTASSVEKAPFFKISKIEVLGFQLEDVEVASHRLPKRVPADGLLGLNVLKHFNVHLEFLKRNLRITD